MHRKGWLLLIFALLQCSQVVDKPNNVLHAPSHIKAYASNGQYNDRVTLSWSRIENADAYAVYKSPSAEGPYNEIARIDSTDESARTSNAPDIIVDPGEDPPDEYPVVVYTTGIDLNRTNQLGQTGKFVYGLDKQVIRIIMGKTTEADCPVNCTVELSGNLFGAYYDCNEVTAAINEAAGSTICETLISGEQGFIKFTSVAGPIVLKNENDPAYETPLDAFIREGTAQDEVIAVNPQGESIIKADDYTGNLEDYLGETDEDGGDPYVIKRTFNQDCYYFTDDMDVVTGTHYFYRVRALRSANIEESLSIRMEGFAASSTAPPAPEGLTVSRGAFSNKVNLSWSSSAGSVRYAIYRASALTMTFGTAPLGWVEVDPASPQTAYGYEDYTIDPGEFAYKIAPFNAGNEEGRHSETAAGFRKITDHEFVSEWWSEIMRNHAKIEATNGFPLTSTQMFGLDKTYNGDKSGNCRVKVTAQGLGGKVAMDYYNYCDLYLTLDGGIVTLSDLSGNGTQTGAYTVSGIYSGTVQVQLEIVNKKSGGGSYFVSQDGGLTTTPIPWSYVY